MRGIPVFNAPYSNTRSVAELVLGEAIMLMRGVFHKSLVCHSGGGVSLQKAALKFAGRH